MFCFLIYPSAKREMRLQHSFLPFSFYLTSHISRSTHTRWQIAGQRTTMACNLVGEQCPHLQHPPDVRHVVHMFVHVQVPPTRLHTGSQAHRQRPTQHRRLGEEWQNVAECGNCDSRPRGAHPEMRARVLCLFQLQDLGCLVSRKRVSVPQPTNQK